MNTVIIPILQLRLRHREGHTARSHKTGTYTQVGQKDRQDEKAEGYVPDEGKR